MLSTLVALTGGAALAGALTMHVALLIDWPGGSSSEGDPKDRLLR